MPAFSANPDVDFDGRDVKRETFSAFNVPKINIIDSQIRRRVRVLLKDGNWLSVEPKMMEDGREYYTFEPGAVIDYTYSCKGNNSGKWNIQLKITNTPSEGGHQHNNPIPPQFTFRNYGAQNFTLMPNPYSSPSLPVNTDLVFSVVMPPYATKLRDRSDFYGACTGPLTDETDVKINLSTMPTGIDYALVGSTTSHPDNHYATSDAIAGFVMLAKDWRAECSRGRLLQFNDMSLIWGGLFDVNKNWIPSHAEHRKGLNVDLSKRNINKSDRKRFLTLACKTFGVKSEGDATGEAPHYHLTVTPPAPDYFYEYPDKFLEYQDYKIIDCCPVDNLSEEDLKKCTELGPGYTESPNVPTCE